MASKKRKPRNTIQEAHKPDLTVPIDLEILGTINDPCFGKLFDPRESACQRCGDSELCGIMLSQNNTKARTTIEKSQPFKDMEEKDILEKAKIEPSILRKSVKNRIRLIIKMSGQRGVKREVVINDVFASYFKDGYTKNRISKLIDKVIETSAKINQNQNLLTWKA